MPERELFVGIDVSKAHLDVAIGDVAETWRVPNTEVGITERVTRLGEAEPALVVLEATGGFEVPSAAALAAANIAVAIANPRQVRDFAKTDRIDAQVLALFAARVRPEVRLLPDEQTRALDAVVARRRQIIVMITAEKNRVGVAPFTRDSGVFRGRRMIFGGRASVRSALYLTIWSASKHNPVIRVFYRGSVTRASRPRSPRSLA
jgi:transposase